MHRRRVGPGEQQGIDQLAGGEAEGEGDAAGPAALLAAVGEPAEQPDAPRLVAAQDGHEQQAQRRGEAAEGLQHAEQPVEAEHRHGEAGHPPEAGASPRRLAAHRDDQRHQGHEGERPHVDAGEGDEVEKAAQERQAVGDAPADQWLGAQARRGGSSAFFRFFFFFLSDGAGASGSAGASSSRSSSLTFPVPSAPSRARL